MDISTKGLFISMLILAASMTEFIVFGGLGVGVVLTTCIYIICTHVYGKQLKKAYNRKQMILEVVAGLTMLCFILYSNEILKICNLLFLAGILLMHAVEYFGKSKYEMFMPEWVNDVLHLGCELPFSNLGKPVELVKSEMSGDNKEKMKVILKVLAGIVLAIPFACIVLVLLISSDAAFSGVVQAIGERMFGLDLTSFLGRAIVGVTLFFTLFSYFYGLGHEKKQRMASGVLSEEKGKEDSIQKDKQEEQVKVRTRGLDPIIVATMGTMLCIIYIVFCLSQSVYFISAFQGVLPEGFSFAEYARRGFFETLPLTGFNLLVICVLNLGIDIKGQKGKEAYMRYMSTFIAGFTLFMIICAFSKMALYMKQYGLTIKRVEVAWFLALIGMIVVMVMIKVYIPRYELIRNLFVTFTIMYLGLNYANVDYFVARYNVQLYRQGVVHDLSACGDLSTSAIGPISEMILEEKVTPWGELEDLLGEYKIRVSDQKWQSWNIADHYAEKMLDKINV